MPQGNVLRGRLEFGIDRRRPSSATSLTVAEVLRFTEPGSVLDAYLEGRFSVSSVSSWRKPIG